MIGLASNPNRCPICAQYLHNRNWRVHMKSYHNWKYASDRNTLVPPLEGRYYIQLRDSKGRFIKNAQHQRSVETLGLSGHDDTDSIAQKIEDTFSF